MTANLLERLRALDTCAVSDALDHLHLSGATTGVRPVHQRCARIAGYARTVEVVDAPAAPAGKHLATRTVAAAGSGDVIVIANKGRVNVSCWGDILTVAAQVNGIEGTVIDGACRDVDAVAAAGYPLWARAAVPVTARGPALRQLARAKRVCASCPVRIDCLEYALQSGQGFGVWGGASEQERRLMRRRQLRGRRDAALSG